MHINLTILTALAVFFHLGTAIASQLLKDNTDRHRIESLSGKVDRIFAAVTALAPALPAAAPRTLGAGLADVAALAGALSASLAPAPPAAAVAAVAPAGPGEGAGHAGQG